MADDAGALLVRSGLVSANALDEARARMARMGGTVGEQLVTTGAITDDELTEFYSARMLVPQVNPNTLARLTQKIVSTIPAEMAIELRAIPVSLDGEHNLTVAMSDPSDRRAVDELAFFTGAYIVRAVATQLQIAWCLAHYYGHVTVLGQRLLQVNEQPSPMKAAIAAASQRLPRAKGVTDKVNAARHRAVAPITGPIDAVRPNGETTSAEITPTGTSAAVIGKPAAGGAAVIGKPPAGGTATNGKPAGGLAAPASQPAGLAGNGLVLPAGAVASPLLVPPGAMKPIAPMAGGVPIAGAILAPSKPMAAVPPSAVVPSAIASAASKPAPLASKSSPHSATLTGVGKTANTAPAVMSANATPAVMPASAPIVAPPGFAPPLVPRAAPDAATLPPELPPPPIVPRPPTLPGTTETSPSPPTTATSVPSTSESPDANDTSDGTPSRPRARSVSGEIRVPFRRAASIRPPIVDAEDDEPIDSGPVIVIEPPDDEDATAPTPAPVRRRRVKSDPPELQARAGEVDLKSGDDRAIDVNEPRIVIDEDALAAPTMRIDTRPVHTDPTPKQIEIVEVDDEATRVDAEHSELAGDDHDASDDEDDDDRDDDRDDNDTSAVIHQRMIDQDSAPILLDRPRGTSQQLAVVATSLRELSLESDDDDTGEIDIVMLESRKVGKPRIDKHTRVGVPPVPSSVHSVLARAHHDTDAMPPLRPPSEPGISERAVATGDATKVDLLPAPPGEDTASDLLAAPPSPASDFDTSPNLLASPPPPRPRALGTSALPPRPRALSSPAPPPTSSFDDDDNDDDNDDDDAENAGADDPSSDDEDADDGAYGEREVTTVRSPHAVGLASLAVLDLDYAIPERTTEFLPGQLLRRPVGYDPIDDGWGPPGTTIPPPLLGAIPGGEDTDESAHVIPMPSIDSAPLLVGPPSLANSGQALARALEDATARAIEVIRELERTHTRDQVVDMMISHLCETHHRAGFFVTRPDASKTVSELSLFAMSPKPPTMPYATLRLDRASTLQDVVGTRLPYRGPMHDDASRSFLIAVLGACPPEVLLVPVAVRERVVGVLFGEHRQRHTFDDQLALAARAAGMALERILKAKRT